MASLSTLSKAPEAWSLTALATRPLPFLCLQPPSTHAALRTHPGLPAWPRSLRCPRPSAITTGSFSQLLPQEGPPSTSTQARSWGWVQLGLGCGERVWEQGVSSGEGRGGRLLSALTFCLDPLFLLSQGLGAHRIAPPRGWNQSGYFHQCDFAGRGPQPISQLSSTVGCSPCPSHPPPTTPSPSASPRKCPGTPCPTEASGFVLVHLEGLH